MKKSVIACVGPKFSPVREDAIKVLAGVGDDDLVHVRNAATLTPVFVAYRTRPIKVVVASAADGRKARSFAEGYSGVTVVNLEL